MNIAQFTFEDIASLSELQPADWDDIKAPHTGYLESPFCNTLKIVKDGRLAGIGTVVHHQDTAWLAHIIVHPNFRNLGLGRTITESLLDSIDKHVFQTVYLIATDLGFPVYSKAGFELEAEYAHFTSNDTLLFDVNPFIHPFTEKLVDEVMLLDQQVYGEARWQKLKSHLPASILFIKDNKLTGVYFPSLANGLIIAQTTEAGIALMKLRLQSKNFAILPVENKAGVSFLEGINLNRVRRSRRMIYGKQRPWQPTGIYNRVSGQIG